MFSFGVFLCSDFSYSWNTVAMTPLTTLSANSSTPPGSGLLFFFSRWVTFLVMCFPGEIWLDAKCCGFYLVPSGIYFPDVKTPGVCYSIQLKFHGNALILLVFVFKIY